MDSQGLMPKPPVLDTQVSHQGWSDVVKNHLSQFDPRVVDGCLYGIGGFMVGYLLKNFGRLLIMAAIGLALVMVVLHVTHVYTVDVAAVKAFTGLNSVASVADLVALKIAWIKDHPLAAVAGILGIMVGWKVG